MSYRFFAPVLASVLVFSAATAKADAPAQGVRLGAGLASGLILNEWEEGARGSLNPQQLGFYGVAGYTFPFGLYLGGSMKIFLGQKEEEPGFKITFMTQQFAFDVGYAFGFGPNLTLRPMLEIGLNRYGIDEDDAGIETKWDDVGIMLNPGVDLVADLTEHIWLGGGLRFGFAFMGDTPDDDIWVSENGTDVSLQFLVDAGFRF